MTASFRINQTGITGGKPPTGTYDRARTDLDLDAVGGPVTTEATAGATTYLWELVSEPEGSSITLSGEATQTATFNIEVTGGYLVRLTIDAALPSEDVLILYLGIPLASSGLPIPAFNEIDFDNSLAPYDAAYGYERKLTAFLKWCDTKLGEEIYEVYPPRDMVEVSVSSVLSADDTGKIIYLDNAVIATLPPAAKGLHYFIYCVNHSGSKPNVLCDGSDTFFGGFRNTYVTPWARIELDNYTGIHIVCADTPTGLQWVVHGGAGIIRNALAPSEDWIISFDPNDVPYIQVGVPIQASGLGIGTHDMDSFDAAERSTAKWRYTITNGTDLRVGHVVGVWQSGGASISFSDVVEAETGDTTDAVFVVALDTTDIELRVTLASATWSFDALRTNT